MLENAYAACQPSPELIATFAKTVTRLQKEDQITSDEALLLRTEMAPREELLKLSQNDSSAVSDSMVIKIRDTYAQTLTDQQNREINDLSSALESEKKKKFTAIDKAEELALDKSEEFGKLLKKIVIGIFVIILLVGLYASIISVMSLDANLIWKVVLVLIGFLGLFDVIKSRNGWINKKIKLLKKNRFDSIYNLEIQKINHYFDI